MHTAPKFLSFKVHRQVHHKLLTRSSQVHTFAGYLDASTSGAHLLREPFLTFANKDMSSRNDRRFTLRYGFIDSKGTAKKLLKLQCKVDSQQNLIDLVALQHDNPLFHTTVHGARGPSKPSRLHHQLENPELWCGEDRNKFPEIVESPLPLWNDLSQPWTLISVPIHWGADRAGRDLYSPMKTREHTENASRIIDLSSAPPDQEFIGNLTIYLIPPRQHATSWFENWVAKSSYDRQATNVVDGISPHVAALFGVKLFRVFWAKCL
jgi:hypothetical protein